MKNLIFINGTMGSGKTSVSYELLKILPNAVFLDGDWCWMSNPFSVTEETKNMVIENISFLLNNFLKCSEYENIIFCWVMHQQEIVDDILKRLELNENINYKIFTLILSSNTLSQRLKNDIEKGIRDSDIIARSTDRLKYYTAFKSTHIEVDKNSAQETAKLIAERI